MLKLRFAVGLLALTVPSAVQIHADQILGPGRIDTSNNVKLPSGPTLGKFLSGKHTATPDSITLPSSDQGKTGDISGMSVTMPSGKARTFSDRFGDAANVLDFVLPADGADYAPAFNRAISTGKQVRVPKVNSGIDIDTCVNLPSGAHILFEASTVVRSTSSTCVFRLTGYNVPSSIEGHAVFDMTNAPSTATAVRFGTQSGVVYRVSLKGLRCYKAYECVGDEASASNYIVDVDTRDLIAEATRGRQFYIRRSRGFFTVDMRVDHTANTSQVTWEGIRLEDVAGLDIQRMDVVGPSTSTVPRVTYQPSSVGIVISNPSGSVASIYNNGRILVDTVRGPGILLSNITNLIGGQIQVYGALGQAFQCQACADMTTSITAVGLVGTSGAVAAPTVEFDNSQRIRGTIGVQNSPSSGIYLNNCTDCAVDVLSSSNAGYGVVESGTRNRVSGTMRGSSGSFSISGTGSVATNYFANDNAFHIGPTSGALP